MIKLTIEMPFKSKKELDDSYKALLPELEFKGRAKIELKKERGKNRNILIIKIEAEDLASLHAAAGSQLRALKVITGVQNFAEE
ncbi:MAG: KEOPS complex subunit Pcc1 [Candidatus Micrarchaeota archaeon]|nr:KEOPS complex subunit Pcc1 [Candidatus Micrarchaeota archaeon]